VAGDLLTPAWDPSLCPRRSRRLTAEGTCQLSSTEVRIIYPGSLQVFRTPGDAIHSEKQRAYGDNHLSKRSTRYRACCPLAHMLHENATHAKPPEKPCVDARIARRPRRHRSEATPSAILYKDVMGEDCPTTGLCPHPQRRRTLLPRRRQHSGLDST
jgi:hypothetical protein